MAWLHPVTKMLSVSMILSLFFFKKYILFIFRERGREGEKEEGNINVWLPLTCPLTGDLALNPGMCPDSE